METQSGSRGEELKATGHTRAADAKEDLEESRRIERFDIPLTNLKSMFEKPTTQSTEVKGSSSSTHRVMDQRRKGSSENKVSNQSEEMSDCDMIEDPSVFLCDMLTSVMTRQALSV
ncbi:hypothetical protein PDJAM_G00113340 [Pangasius djambal]|uniref:Uncharacterized protein n=1 Tax=Pangasius djambal TaxID=1691987 RepID=A0ACC5Y390_9TELE|nr:hypothetical protein [Pangasius djambal]